MFYAKYDTVKYKETRRGILATVDIYWDESKVCKLIDQPEAICARVEFYDIAYLPEFVEQAMNAGFGHNEEAMMISEFARNLLSIAEEKHSGPTLKDEEKLPKLKEVKGALIASKVAKEVGPLLANLWVRWQDEKQYENIEDYGIPIQTKLAEMDIWLLKMSKRPFGFTFEVSDEVWSLSAKAKGKNIDVCLEFVK